MGKDSLRHKNVLSNYKEKILIILIIFNQREDIYLPQNKRYLQYTNLTKDLYQKYKELLNQYGR